MKLRPANSGYTLIELLMVVSIFAVLAMLSTMSLGLVLKTSKKSDSIVQVRSDISYALGVIERHVRNAKSITCTSATRIDYISEFSIPTSFECLGGASGYVASGSARLTSPSVLMDCTGTVFSCTTIGTSERLDVNLTGAVSGASDIEGARVSSQTQILLRNYVRR